VAQFTSEAQKRDRDLAAVLSDAQEQLRVLYPLFAAPDVTERLTNLLNSHELRAALDLN
jgi:hypothetical protein